VYKNGCIIHCVRLRKILVSGTVSLAPHVDRESHEGGFVNNLRHQRKHFTKTQHCDIYSKWSVGENKAVSVLRWPKGTGEDWAICFEILSRNLRGRNVKVWSRDTRLLGMAVLNFNSGHSTDCWDRFIIIIIILLNCKWVFTRWQWHYSKTNNNSVALVRERTIPHKRPPLVGEDSAHLCW
jgi:hypothetical protein